MAAFQSLQITLQGHLLLWARQMWLQAGIWSGNGIKEEPGPPAPHPAHFAGRCLFKPEICLGFSFCSALCTKQKGFPVGEAAPALPSVINIAHTVTKHPPGKQLTPIILPESHPGGTEQR